VAIPKIEIGPLRRGQINIDAEFGEPPPTVTFGKPAARIAEPGGDDALGKGIAIQGFSLAIAGNWPSSLGGNRHEVQRE
jgi:hypothetical protein